MDAGDLPGEVSAASSVSEVRDSVPASKTDDIVLMDAGDLPGEVSTFQL